MSSKRSEPDAQKPTAEESEGQLITKVMQWAENQGYPFELSVGQAFRNAGWDVEHVRFYTDAQTGKSRQTDVFASKAVTIDEDLLFHLALVIECKRSRSRPWVVFSAPSKGVAPLSDLYVSGVVAQRALVTAFACSGGPDRFALTRLGERLGHGIVSANVREKEGERERREPDFAYNALQSAISGAAAMSRVTDGYNLAESPHPVTVIQLVFPVVVFDGALFELALADGRGIVCGDILAAKVLCANQTASQGSQVVSVIAPYYLPIFIQKVTDDFLNLSDVMRQNGWDIIREAREAARK